MVNSNTLILNLAKSKAKKIKKSQGVSHSEALNIAARDFGFSNFKNLQNSKSEFKKAAPLINPELHLNKMPLNLHVKVALLLKDVLSFSFLRKSVYKEVDAVRCELDNWIEQEHRNWRDFHSLSLYYDDLNHQYIQNLTLVQSNELNQKIDDAISILNSHYSEDKIKPLLMRLKRAQRCLKIWSLVPQKARSSSPWRPDNEIKVGTVFYFKKGSGDKSAIVLAHDVVRSTIVYCDYESIGTCDRSSISVPRIRKHSCTAIWPMRLYMPYGKWTLLDGTEVLYNRNYQPIWWKSPTGEIISKKPSWVDGIQSDEDFFNDASKPWAEDDSKQRCEQVLKDFGVFGKRPYLLQLIDNHISGQTVLDSDFLENINRLK